jgi:hypothetical protein
MNTASTFTSRLLAAAGAFVITASLLLGSFAADPQVQSIAGVLA